MVNLGRLKANCRMRADHDFVRGLEYVCQLESFKCKRSALMEVECNVELYLGSKPQLVGGLLAEKPVNQRCSTYILGGLGGCWGGLSHQGCNNSE